MRPNLTGVARPNRKGVALLWIFLRLAWGALGAETDRQPLSSGVITNAESFWGVTGAERSLLHPIQADFLIYYFDPVWKASFGEFSGTPTFLPISDAPLALRAGQKLEVDGLVLPTERRILWDRTKTRLTAPAVELKPLATRGDLTNYERFTGRFVEVAGLVDAVDRADPAHVNLHLLAEGVRTLGVLQLRQTNTVLPAWEGTFARLKGVYVEEKDLNRRLTGVTIWVDDPGQVEITGRLSTDPRFEIPTLPAERISQSQSGALVKVEGQVRNQEPGKAVTLWDDTGQVRVETGQTSPLQPGDRVEAVGYPVTQGIELRLREGTYRRAAGARTAPAANRPPQELRLAEQVRELSREEAERGALVNLEGVVTWADAHTGFIFIMDSSAGIRVVNARLDGRRAIAPRMMVTVKGVTTGGDFVPVITNAVVRQIGLMELAEPWPVSLEQALTGVEDGRWVEMQGFVRQVTEENGLARLDLTTRGGEFVARAPTNAVSPSIKGAMIRIRGVCGVIPNAHRQLTGIELWTPLPQMIQVEQAAPPDLFALPERSIGSLRLFSAFNAVNQRVRIKGTVVLRSAGSYLYVQDHGDSLFVLSRQLEPLNLGDQIEVVGFPGNDGRRFLLREAAYRRLSSGPEPAPLKLEGAKSGAEDLAGLLVETEGFLLNVACPQEGPRLLLEARGSVFEAHWEGKAAAGQLDSLQKGSRLRLRGVYELQPDAYGKPKGFVLRLRSWDDIAVLEKAPWWTLARLWWVVAGVITVFVLALLYAVLVSGKNRLLHEAQANLQRANEELEDRVARRTSELREEVAAKERAHTELGQAQERLITASRQAGMADVATEILHNVGNVLNSVNVSAGLLLTHARQSRLASLPKLVTLLEAQNGRLAEFLTQDPKGQRIPGFLGSLSKVWIEEQTFAIAELRLLSDKIDHIKEIVAMQQNYATVSGVIEALSITGLVDEAIRLNAGALGRQGVRMEPQFEEVPLVVTDKHKVLQILLNLIRNAHQACQEGGKEPKVVISRVFSPNPERVSVQVIDNGIGIRPENLNKIFSHGFTTRKDGHGFGLHSGANAAKSLGGNLTAQSAGPGQGATFTLELPVQGKARSRQPSEA